MRWAVEGFGEAEPTDDPGGRVDSAEQGHHGLAACDIFRRCSRKHTGKPAIAQLVEHLTVELCSYQMVPDSIRVAGF